MITAPEKLHDALKVIFDDIRKDKKQIIKINKLLSEYNVPVGTFDEVLNKPDKLNEIDPDILCLVTLTVYEVTGNNNINPEKYYNKKEIDVAKRYTHVEENKIEYPLYFSGVIKVGDYDYVTVMSIQDIAKYLDAQILEYNFETQRTPLQRVTKTGSIIQKPYVNPQSVKQISKLVVDEKYTPDMITFNVLMDGNDDISYNDKTHELVINSGKLDILDGFHRIQGIVAALESNPNIKMNLIVSIKNYPLDKARWHFGQINTINIPDKTRIKEAKNETVAVEIVNELRRTSDNLRHRISSNTRVSIANLELTNSAILADTIQDVFNPQTRKDFLDMSRYLRDFFDYLIDSFNEEFVTNFAETRKHSWINNQYMFIGYVVLAKKIFDSDKDVTRVVDIVSGIDFNKGTSDFDSILNGEAKESALRIRKRIKEYFEQIIV